MSSHSGSIIHARHAEALGVMKRASLALPTGQKYIVIVYDGPQVPQSERLASFASDSPQQDVATVCRAVAEQITGKR